MSLEKKESQNTLYLTLNRPTRANSLDPPTIIALRQAFLDAQSNPNIRVIVLTGSGNRDFTTGIDISAAAPLGTQAIGNIADTAGDIATLIYHGKPTIVAINGRAMGMGGLFAAAADYRLIHETAFIRMPEINIPVFPGGTAIAIFTRICGISWTKRIFLLGEPLSPKDALNANLVDEIVPNQQELERRTSEVAQNLAMKNSAVVKGIKLAAPNALDIPYSQVLELESQLTNFFDWKSEDQTLTQIAKHFNIQFQLKGDPDRLLKDYQQSRGK
ncbi:MAG: enoyl-CoA hydratase/isomerase family protein [Candidatus Hodarchaeota archaeon]